MVKVEFIKNFATKKKGDTGSFDSQLARILVTQKKVAKFIKEKAEK